MTDFDKALLHTIGSRIKRRREEIGLNQIELSNQIGLGRTSVSNIEKGRQQPPLSVLYTICDSLNIDIHLVLPTYAEVESSLKSENQSEVDKYLNTLNLDANTANQIRKLISKNDSNEV